jgi:hypothetical protein
MARNTKAQVELQEDEEVSAGVEAAVPSEMNGSHADGEGEPVDEQDIDEILTSLKTLLSTVEKLQKIRQEVGDIKPLLVRMLDGELVAGEELENLKVGVNGLLKLVRAHSDHQAALARAQSARSLLDEVFKATKSS